jgi:hypothetical protein
VALLTLPLTPPRSPALPWRGRGSTLSSGRRSPSTGFRGYAEAGWQTGATAYNDVTIAATFLGAGAGGDLFRFRRLSVKHDRSGRHHAGLRPRYHGAGRSCILRFARFAPEGADEVYCGIDNSQPPTLLDAGVTFLSPPGWCSDDAFGCTDPAPTSASVTNVDPASVPEPASGILVAAGLAAGALMKRSGRRRRY